MHFGADKELYYMLDGDYVSCAVKDKGAWARAVYDIILEYTAED